MKSFWEVVKGWEPMGQGIFFLLIFGGSSSFIIAVIRYLAVLVRGWPPNGCF